VSMLGVSLAAARRPTNVFSQGTRNLIAALKGAGVRRLIVQSSFGVGDSRRDAGLLERVFYALLRRGASADKVLQGLCHSNGSASRFGG
jgi:nucleoside-diphosphate-sugar epimerase